MTDSENKASSVQPEEGHVRPVEAGPMRPGLGFGGLFATPGAGLVMIGILSVVLMVPMFWLMMLTDERATRATDVSKRIALSWGGPQQVNGPYIVVPRLLAQTTSNDRDPVILMADTVDAKADMAVELRHLSIYSTPVYKAKVTLHGRFSAETLNELQRYSSTLDWDKARLVIGIDDPKGIRSNATIRIGSFVPARFEPGLGDVMRSSPEAANGISVALPLQKVMDGFDFDAALDLNGSNRFTIPPAGQTTSLSISGNWPHPGFEGFTLPDEQTITDKDFSGSWKVPYLARGIGKSQLSAVLPFYDNGMSVNLVEPVDFYQEINRTLKYAFGFFVVTFFSVFLLAVKARQRVFAVQYLLTGSAIGVFYLLLLGLGEHLGFGLAYLIGAGGTTGLIGLYGTSLVGSRRYGMILTAVLVVSYGLLYLLMREEEFALLAGSLIAFATVAVTMYTTRQVDWSGKRTF